MFKFSWLVMEKQWKLTLGKTTASDQMVHHDLDIRSQHFIQDICTRASILIKHFNFTLQFFISCKFNHKYPTLWHWLLDSIHSFPFLSQVRNFYSLPPRTLIIIYIWIPHYPFYVISCATQVLQFWCTRYFPILWFIIDM